MLQAMMKMLIMMKDFSHSFHSMVSLFVIWTHLECCVPSRSPLCTQYIQPPTPCSLCTHCIVVMHTAETSRLAGQHGTRGYPSSTHLKLIYRSPLTYCSVVAISFWNIVQSTVVLLPCSVQIFTIWQLKWVFCTNEISRELGWRVVSDRYPILQWAPVYP